MTSPTSSKYVIQLRGTNASGKSTAMRQYCAARGLKPTWLDTSPKRTKIMSDGKISVLGWYQPYSIAEGCDAALSGRAQLLSALEALFKRGQEVVAFEGMIYSNTYLLPTRVDRLAKKYGYKFIACFLACSYTTELQRLMNRNGGKDIDFDNFDMKFYTSRKSFGKLLQSGILCYEVDTDRTPIDDMGGVIEEAIRGCK